MGIRVEPFNEEEVGLRWKIGLLGTWAVRQSVGLKCYLLRDFRDFRVLTLHSRISLNNFGKSDLLPEKLIGIFGFRIFGFGFRIFGFRVRESGNMPTRSGEWVSLSLEGEV